MIQRIMCFLFMAGAVQADTVVAARTIRAESIILPADLAMSSDDLSNGFSRALDIIGQESRVILYAGRPILVGDIGPPAIVTRNQIVRLQFTGAGLNITTEGRALERGAVGDRVRVMNLASRATLFGQVQEDGSIKVTR